jgi:hypothetical protein
MNGIYNQSEIASFLCSKTGKKPTTRAIMKALERAGIPYKQGIDGVFTTHEAINKALLGTAKQQQQPNEITLL